MMDDPLEVNRDLGNEYADCAICGETTHPEAEQVRVDKPGNVVVVQLGNGRQIAHEQCDREGVPSDLEAFAND